MPEGVKLTEDELEDSYQKVEFHLDNIKKEMQNIAYLLDEMGLSPNTHYDLTYMIEDLKYNLKLEIARKKINKK